jgi:hypothetical protein
VLAGYVDALSAGDDFAVHDAERSLCDTSPGVDTETVGHPRKGHGHHSHTVSEVVRAGSIPVAVGQGVVTEGVTDGCVENDVPYALAGSIRDDGPLADTTTDAVETRAAIREQAHETDLVVMLASLPDSMAVGSCLPSTTRATRVDVDPATVTQPLDRASSRAVGVATDAGTFVPRLANELLDEPDD